MKADPKQTGQVTFVATYGPLGDVLWVQHDEGPHGTLTMAFMMCAAGAIQGAKFPHHNELGSETSTIQIGLVPTQQ
jgi:hypothetical protein